MVLGRKSEDFVTKLIGYQRFLYNIMWLPKLSMENIIATKVFCRKYYGYQVF